MPLFAFLGPAIAGVSVVLARFLVPLIIAKVIIALGLSAVTFVGVDLLGDYLVSQVRSASTSLGGDLINVAAMAGFFDWLEIVLAAWIAAINIRSIRGAFKQLTFAS